MNRRRACSGVSGALLGAVITVMAPPSRAQETPLPAEKPWYESVGVGVFLETTYTHNLNRPDSSTNQLRVFDTEADDIRFDVVELVLQKKASAPGEAGFRVDAFAGSSIPHVTAAAGLFRDETGKAQDFDLFQAFVTYVAPVGSGLKVDAGKFATFMCYELVEGPDGINDNVSRSLLFGWAMPTTHTGIRASYAFSSKLSAQLHLVNGWDVVKDGNSARAIGAQVAYAPTPSVTVILKAMTGPEKAGNDRDWRRPFDLVATWKVGERVSLALNADFSTEQGSRPNGGSAYWGGVAGYVRYTAHPRLSFSVRAEVFRDADGVRTGTSQTVKEVTLTPEWKLGRGFVVRSDLRHDWSDEPVFERRDQRSKGQTTASLNAAYVF